METGGESRAPSTKPRKGSERVTTERDGSELLERGGASTPHSMTLENAMEMRGGGARAIVGEAERRAWDVPQCCAGSGTGRAAAREEGEGSGAAVSATMRCGGSG
jgi:hypothetical protein